ncbi:phage tail protein [Thalassovita sp.]|uniref:phage tail protein n=1 Tax=Thalassovita sp. TaxID=1979401 RepID=UPI003B594586
MPAPIFTPAYEPTLSGYSDEKAAKVRRAEFEGGYSQRSRVGPNALGRTVPVQWEVPDSVKTYIDGFFEARGGSEAFQYQLPWDGTAKLWTAEAWTVVPIGKRGVETMWRLSATLRQEFDIL